MVTIYKHCLLPENIDLVIHLAGISGVRQSLDNPQIIETKCNCKSKNI